MNIKYIPLLFLPVAFMFLLMACGGDTKPLDDLDDYSGLVTPIEDERGKLYERMNDGFDDVYASMVTAHKSSSQAVQAEALAEVRTYLEEMYNEWDSLLRRFVQITPPGELVEFHEFYQEGIQLYHRAFFTAAAGMNEMGDEMGLTISNDMLEADRKFTRARAEWAKVQARYK